MFEWYEDFDWIPEPRSVRDCFGGDDRGHVEYTGDGSGKNYDYWDCYCMWYIRPHLRPVQPLSELLPKTLDQLLLNVKDPEKVRAWWKKYKFNVIYCICDCCQGAIPRLVFGWETNRRRFNVSAPDSDKYEVDSDESDCEVKALPDRPNSSSHAF